METIVREGSLELEDGVLTRKPANYLGVYFDAPEHFAYLSGFASVEVWYGVISKLEEAL